MNLYKSGLDNVGLDEVIQVFLAVLRQTPLCYRLFDHSDLWFIQKYI